MTNKDVVKSMSKQTGFTIVELLVVIVVIGILAAITIVSYAGITNRATIASIQSDLTSASTLLKMDQITTESFPTTLALANSGKGITPSQTMDSVIYIPDNTSNPKTFCLQYKKGTNTYAVDSTSSPSKGVCLINLVVNGDFRNGTSGWNIPNSTNFTTNSGTGSFVATGQWGNVNNRVSLIAGHVYYASADIKADTTNVIKLLLQNDAGGSVTASADYTNVNNFQHLSGTGVASATNITNAYLAIVDYRPSGWTTVYCKNNEVIDLTAIFGAGNEPSKTQMDTIMTNYPNNWFNIVAKANL